MNLPFLYPGNEYLAKHSNFKLVGRDEELRRISSILMRQRANSILLNGPRGVGCSTLCLGLQAGKSATNTPFDIVSKRFFWLEVDDLFSSGDNEATNKAFASMMAVLKRTPDSVLIIEDTKDFIDACRNKGATHFINALILSVQNGHNQVILETCDDDMDSVLGCHSDVRECFTLLDLEEPTGANLETIIENSAASLASFHNIKISDDARKTAIELTNKYRTQDPGVAQPGRSITLLDRALASYRFKAHSTPSHGNGQWTEKQQQIFVIYTKQREAERKVIELELELKEQQEKEAQRRLKAPDEPAPTEKAKRFADVITDGGFDSNEIREIKHQIEGYSAVVDENKAKFDKLTAEINASLELTRDLVLQEFSSISGISASKLGENDREKLSRLENELKKRIFGQDDVVRRVADGVKVQRLGHQQGERPLPFFFMGPSGVGKTEMAKALAAALLDDENALTRFDMSEYMEKHAVAKLIGAPPGYELAEVGGILTNAMRKNPKRVLLFDEVEKAHDDVFNIFLQILGDGRLTDAIGRVVSFRDSIIIMTTNIGQDHFLHEATFDAAKDAAMKELTTRYRGEFLNRFNGRQNIYCFEKLDLVSIEKIVTREIAKLNVAYKENDISIVLPDNDLNVFCQDQYDPTTGARGLPGYIQANIEPFIVNALLQEGSFAGVVNLSYNRGARKFDVELKKSVDIGKVGRFDPSERSREY